MQAHAGPHGLDVAAQGAGAQPVARVLKLLRVVVEPPDHEVGVASEPGDVVPAAGGDLGLVDEVVRLADEPAAGVLEGGQRRRESVDGVQGVVETVVDRVQVDVGGVARVMVGAALFLLEAVQVGLLPRR